MRKGFVIALVVVTGVALELTVELMTGRREAWDSDVFWTLGVPIAALISVLAGFMSQGRDWLWAAALVPAQVTTMMVTSGDILGGLGLWPLMVALASVLSAPFVGAAYIGSRFRRMAGREAPAA
jgi:hypothetical protein